MYETFDDFELDMKEKFEKGKVKAKEIWDNHKGKVIGIGVASIALLSGIYSAGKKNGTKSQQKLVDKANEDAKKYRNSADEAWSALEVEVLKNEAYSEMETNIVMTPDGNAMSGNKFIDTILENATTDELKDIMSR